MRKRNHTVTIRMNKAEYDLLQSKVKESGKTQQEVVIKAIADLKAKVGIKRTIKDYGVKEEDFLATLDEMVENAFNDQCTGANPRYPLFKEIKAMYLKAYYEG